MFQQFPSFVISLSFCPLMETACSHSPSFPPVFPPYCLMSWQKLTIALKAEIIVLLDYESRCNLKLCSKDDREAVEETKLVANRLEIFEVRSEMSPGKTTVRLKIDGFTCWFTGRENVTRIDRGWNGVIVEEFSETVQQNRYDLVREFMERLCLSGLFEVDTFEVDDIEFPPPEHWEIYCQNLLFPYAVIETYIQWMQKIKQFCQKFKKLEVGDVFGRNEESMDLLNGIQATESLKIDHNMEMTDDELDRIEAQDLRIFSMNLTWNAVRRKLESFLKYGKKDEELDIYFQLPENFNSKEMLLSKNLVLKAKQEYEELGEFNGDILGGFENVHGVQDPREIDCRNYGHAARIYCKVHQKPIVTEFKMYPF